MALSTLSNLPFVLMRGGTSKGVFLEGKNLPADRVALSAMLLDVMGSPDRRQIDGLGGADKLTSKVAIISASERQDADIDYLFAQVGIQAPEVDFQINCGNLTAAAAVRDILPKGRVTPAA
jgi:2-methylaconitate cis-trans-isomerase PrpF